jgi:hypothetical protein
VKIVIASVRDTGGTGWNLAHAINRVAPEHHAIDMTGVTSYIKYPQILNIGNYNKTACRKILYQADVIVFLSTFNPLMKSFRLSKKKLRDKKKIFYYCGSEWRYSRKRIINEIDTTFKDNYTIAVATPGMMLPGEDDDATPCPSSVKFLPWTRSFTEIKQLYGLCNQDQNALKQFTIPFRRVVFLHAPTSEANKGSATFYRVMTQCMQMVPNLTFAHVRGQPWVSCLQSIARSDLVFDQDPPFPEAYGVISVEASIFKLPVITRVAPDCIKYWQQNEGLNSPFVQWRNDADLLEKVYHLATNEKLRETFGEANYKFCKALHDEKPVVDRFLKIVEGIN